MSIQGTPGRLRHNIAALGVVQIGNYLIPLLTLPYLTRVLGTHAFGQIAFAQIFMAYFVMLTEYGFNWSASRKIAANREDRAYVSQVFVGVWSAQWLLLLVSALFAMLVVGASDRLRPDAALYAMAFAAVLGNVAFPIWLLQGLEQMKEVALIQVVIRVSVLPLIFTLIDSPADAIWVLAINGGAVILGGVITLYWIRKQGLIDWRWPTWEMVSTELREGGGLFGSRVAVSLYTTTIPLVLGWLVGPVAVSYYTLADKLRAAAQALLEPLSQALYPRMSNLMRHAPDTAFGLLKRSALLVVTVAGGVSMVLWWMADSLVMLFGGNEFLPAATVLRWLAPVPLVVGVSNLLGIQLMLPMQLKRPFNLILVSAGMFCLLIIWPLVEFRQAVGAAQTMLAVELFVTLAMGLYLWRRSPLSAIGCKTR